VTEADHPETQASSESKPPEAVQSTPATVSQPVARELLDWSSELTAEAGHSEEWYYSENYYWTPQARRVLAKLQSTKRALIGVVGVQGVGKTATMRMIWRTLVKGCFDYDHVIAVKVPESGGLTTALKTALNPPDSDYSRLEDMLGHLMAERLFHDSILQRRVRSRDRELAEKVENTSATFDDLDVLKLRTLIPQRVVRELEMEALRRLLEYQKVIMIDMPDYPRHDRRLIARDLDDIAGLWNRLMVSAQAKETSLIVFIQKETFSAADHFFYGKCDIIPLMPLTLKQLLDAYIIKWRSYAPFTEEALQYIAKMSRGVFRRFKRYIGLALETWIADRVQVPVAGGLIDLEAVKKSVTNEEVMRDMDKELDGIFRKREQKEKALELIKKLSEPHIRAEEAKAAGAKSLKEFIRSDADSAPEGIPQQQLAWDMGLSEMAFSRLVRELEQHGYVKRTAWRQWTYVDMNW
jgi:dephospho-CoA kinase